MNLNDMTASLGARVLETGHRTLLALTGGRFPRTLLGMETIELHTTGRKSGQRRSSMLTAPVFGPDRIVVIASKGGHSDHPDWYKNLVANPDVEVTAGDTTTPWTAHTAQGQERVELWKAAAKANPGYDGYQRKTDREIPVVVLTPRV